MRHVLHLGFRWVPFRFSLSRLAVGIAWYGGHQGDSSAPVAKTFFPFFASVSAQNVYSRASQIARNPIGIAIGSTKRINRAAR